MKFRASPQPWRLAVVEGVGGVVLAQQHHSPVTRHLPVLLGTFSGT